MRPLTMTYSIAQYFMYILESEGIASFLSDELSSVCNFSLTFGNLWRAASLLQVIITNLIQRGGTLQCNQRTLILPVSEDLRCESQGWLPEGRGVQLMTVLMVILIHAHTGLRTEELLLFFLIKWDIWMEI